jgi:hypothetical protein
VFVVEQSLRAMPKRKKDKKKKKEKRIPLGILNLRWRDRTRKNP